VREARSAEADTEAARGVGTNITAANASRLDLDQDVVVADWGNGHIANLYGHRPQENARPVRLNVYRHRFLLDVLLERFGGGSFDGGRRTKAVGARAALFIAC
jgi:hypothetical protein